LEIDPTVQSTIYNNRFVNSLSLVASTTHSFGARAASHRPHSYRPKLGVANSRGVSVVVTQEPAQPLATLYSFIRTSFRDLRKQQTLNFP
jgi:hypothetical protein